MYTTTGAPVVFRLVCRWPARSASIWRKLCLVGAIAAAAGWFSPPGLSAQERPAPKSPRTALSAVTPVVRDPKRHEEIMAHKSDAPIDLLFLGASITQFWPERGPDSWAKFAPYHPANFGAAGECTENTLWRVMNGELDGLHPKVVVVNLGNNNIGGHPDEQPAWVAAGVKKVLDVIHQKLPDAKILLLGILPRDGKLSSNRQRNDAVNRIMAGFGAGDRLRYLDIGRAFVDPRGELLPGALLPDNLHPSAKGYQLWYDAMLPTLAAMMK